MGPRIIDGPGSTTFSDSFRQLEISLDEYKKVPIEVEDDSLAHWIHETMKQFLKTYDIEVDLPFYQCVLMSLGSSAAAGVALRTLHQSSVEVPNSAQQTLIRSMILGASRVIYVYSESDPEKCLMKAMSVLSQEFNYAAKAAQDFSSFQHYIPMKRSQSWVKDLGECAKLIKGVAGRITETEIIVSATSTINEAILSVTPRRGEVEHVLDEQVQYSWRFMSANAHGYAWPTLYGADANFTPGSPEDDLHLACMLLHSGSYLARQRSVKDFKE